MKCESCGASVRVLRTVYECNGEDHHHYVEEGDPKPEPKHHPRMNIPARESMPNNPAEIRMPFGKHKGELIEDLPSDYIRWCLENLERLDSAVQKEMEEQLLLREGKGRKR